MKETKRRVSRVNGLCERDFKSVRRMAGSVLAGVE